MSTLSVTQTLANGVEIPVIGYGTWQISDADQAATGVSHALATGYRHVDTAAAYGNEEAVGAALAQAFDSGSVSRQDIFVTTKLWNSARGYESALAAFDESLRKLGLEYVDLYLIHWPANSRQFSDTWRQINADTWRAFEEIYVSGRAKAIGVSNFTRKHLSALLEDASVAPMVNQIELHPGFGQWDAAEFSMENGLVVEAWSPLGSGKILGDASLGAVASEVGRTPAQVALRWLLDQDIVVLPKSVTPERIESNTDLDFTLTGEQAQRIAAIVDDADHAQPDEVDF